MSVDDEYVWFVPSVDLFSGVRPDEAFASFEACVAETLRRGEEPAAIQKMPRALLDVTNKEDSDGDA